MSYLDEVLINLSNSRLELLLSERLSFKGEPEKQKVIDQRIWDLFGEQWCILFTDLSGFSKNAERFGIIHFLQTIKEAEKLITTFNEENKAKASPGKTNVTIGVRIGGKNDAVINNVNLKMNDEDYFAALMANDILGGGGEGYLFKSAKKKFMNKITVEGAQLAKEIGPTIFRKLERNKFPLMFNILNTICKNKKLNINW